MSLHINLIFDNERRSGSLITVRSVLRVTAIVVPAIILTLGAGAWLSISSLKGEYAELEETHRQIEKHQTEFTTIKTDDNKLSVYLNDVERFHGARITWNEHLVAIREVLPENLRVNSLEVKSSIDIPDEKQKLRMARMYVMTMKGVTTGTGDDLEKVRNTIATAPQFTNEVQAVSIGDFSSEGPHNTFELLINYHPRYLK